LGIEVRKVPKKPVVRVVLSPTEKEILYRICVKLGQSESETLKIAFLEYAKNKGLIAEKLRSK